MPSTLGCRFVRLPPPLDGRGGGGTDLVLGSGTPVSTGCGLEGSMSFWLLNSLPLPDRSLKTKEP